MNAYHANEAPNGRGTTVAVMDNGTSNDFKLAPYEEYSRRTYPKAIIEPIAREKTELVIHPASSEDSPLVK